MELCCPPRALSTLPRCRDFAANSSLPLPVVLPRPSPALSWRRSLAFRSTRGWRATASEETSMSVVSTEFGMESDDEEAVEMVEVESFRAGPTEERAPASGDALSWAADFLSKLNLEFTGIPRITTFHGCKKGLPPGRMRTDFTRSPVGGSLQQLGQ